MEKAKDMDIKNPALAFISGTGETQVGRSKEPVQKKESRSQRIQILVQPSTLTRMRELADWEALSVNEVVNRAIIEYLDRMDS